MLEKTVPSYKEYWGDFETHARIDTGCMRLQACLYGN